MNYYSQNALEFHQRTNNLSMQHLYSKFLPLVKGKKILDFGCDGGGY